MPSIAILGDQVVSVDDIYKFNIDTTSHFKCYNCDERLHFRKSRNAENNYTEHFYHQNTVKDTHIECEKATVERKTDSWHNMMTGFMKKDSCEILRKNDVSKHLVDTYCTTHKKGVEFQNSPIKVEDVLSRDKTSDLDWIFNVENQYIRKVEIGDRVICEIPHTNWENAVAAVGKNCNIYLYTGCNEWITLFDTDSYRVEIDRRIRHVWIGFSCSFQEVCENTCIQCNATSDCIEYFKNITKKLDSVRMIYARCKKSMYLLDDIHRDYVNKHDFKKGDIMAICSVAGSGKTTTLLNLAKIHKDKRILYTAFNTSLIEEINNKLREQKITNVKAINIDKLLYHIYISKTGNEHVNIVQLSPQTIADAVPWLKGKPFAIKKNTVKLYSDFCNQPTYAKSKDYCDNVLKDTKTLLLQLWTKTLDGEFITFESLRKLSLNQQWFKKYVEDKYDMVMVDETQDFDIMMLRMLLDHTTIPKIFVGDPRQAIYEWRGSVNGFNYMPPNSLILEFYSTFRVGDPACETIRQRFSDCWMISKSKNETVLNEDLKTLDNKPYTYLFRTWRKLLQTASSMDNIWINSFSEKIRAIRKQHALIMRGISFDDDEYEDDLPKFLKTLSISDLESMISKIEENMTTMIKCSYKFYTIHGYKGLEDDNVRLSDDVTEEEENLYYVALTRGRKLIVED